MKSQNSQIKVGEFEGKEVFEIYGGLLSEDGNANQEFKDQIELGITEFEQSQLPTILGGTFDSIVANPNDNSQDVHSFYYHGFRDAFRKYIVDYVSRGRDADNAEIRMAFNKLKNDLHNIDPSVNLVRFGRIYGWNKSGGLIESSGTTRGRSLQVYQSLYYFYLPTAVGKIMLINDF